MNITNCPSCLKKGFDSFCLPCLKRLFNGKKVSHVLTFTRPEFDTIKRERGGKLSISGIQIKHSLRLEARELVLTEKKGEYILKPIPSGQFKHLGQVPANEHLTMQIANQVFNINTAVNGLFFFSDGEPAYITKRFDILTGGKRLLQEDFAQIANRTEETHGKNYKYDFSYEEIAALMKKYINAYKVEVEKYFRIILFNYLFSNGDSHLKNFSLFRNETYGDYLLTPFYDLLNTGLHVPGESDMALDLFKDDYMTESFKAGSKFTKQDFYEFALKIGINEKRFRKIYDDFLKGKDEVEKLILRSFLNEDLEKTYFEMYLNKLSRLAN